jgi:L-alanine-DL-glutamate epimerase-like enolase superfamily enzyme
MPEIAEIHTITFRLPLAGDLNWGKAGYIAAAEHVLVRLVTDTGHIGLAEAPPRPTIYGETTQSIHAIIQDYLKPALIGLDIFDRSRLKRVLDPVAGNNTAKGALDICLHDAKAASQGTDLLSYMQPSQRKVKVSYILGISDQETMLAEARSVYDRGVRVFKVKVGRNFANDLAVIDALVQEFSGSDVSLYADANEAFLPVSASDQLRQLAARGLLYVEEPLATELIDQRARLRAEKILPLISDDSAFTLSDLERELHFDTFDILNIKPARTGYTESLEMLAAATQLGKGVMVGSQASTTIGTIRAAIFAGMPGIDHPSELSFFLKLEDEIVTRPLKLEDGFLDLDQLVAVKIDDQKLAQVTVRQEY